MSSSDVSSFFSPHRVEALSDGVFAIVMTILVLELSVSGLAGTMTERLAEMWPHFYGYIVSFLVLGIYWIIHRYQFHFIRRSDGVMIWINILFLMTVALVPFSNSLLVYGEQASVIFYMGSSLVSMLLLYIFWWYATRNCRLVDSDIKQRSIDIIKKMLLIPIILIPVIIGSSFFSVALSIEIMVLLFVFYILLTALVGSHLESSKKVERTRLYVLIVVFFVLWLIISRMEWLSNLIFAS